MRSAPLGGEVRVARSTAEAPEQAFLVRLFGTLRASSVGYAVLRNYEQLPRSVAGSDLDLLVIPAHEARARAVIAGAIQGAGGVLVGRAETLGFLKLHVLGRAPGERAGWWGLCVDLNFGLAFEGFSLLACERLERFTAERRGVTVLLPPAAAVLGVLKELLQNATLPPRYLRGARAAVEGRWAALEELLAPMGPRALESLRSAILQAHDPAAVRRHAAALRWALRRAALRRSPWNYAGARCRQAWSKVNRFARPPGVVLAVLGVDGAGKSTLIQGLLPVLGAATHGAVRTRHLRPELLPPLARLKGRREEAAGPVLDPHASAPSGRLGSLLRLAYYGTDYVLGYWALVRPFVARCPAIWIFDRYAHDMALDPRRFRIADVGRAAWRLARLVPRPDLLVCLDAPARVVEERKHELPRAEIERQRRALRELAEREPRAFLVSTDRPSEAVRDQVLARLLDLFSHREALGARP